MKVSYYLLGLLIRFGRQHGYSLKETVSREVADFAKIKLPTIYYNLEKLEKQGYVSATVEKDGNRPEKTVYEITDQGSEYFQYLTGEILQENYEPEFIMDGVLFFLDLVSQEKVIESLQKKEHVLEAAIQATLRHHEAVLRQIPPEASFLVETIFDHHLSHMRTELEWIKKVIKGFKQ